MIYKKIPAILSVLVFAFILSGCPDGKFMPLPDPLDFGKVLIGDSVALTGQWINQADTAGVVKGLIVEPAPSYTTTSPTPDQLVFESSKTKEYTFVFSPEYSGAIKGTAAIVTTTVRAKKMNLTGEGVYLKDGKVISLTGGDLVNDKPLDFKEVETSKSKTLVFTLKNSDPDKAVTLKSSFLKKSGAFSVSDPTGDIAVPSKGEVKVTVTFSPSEVKDYTDILIFTDPNEPLNSSGTVVKGKGVKQG